MIGGTPVVRAQDSASSLMREYGIKAGFLYNFLGFVTWPADALPANAPWRVGVVDDTGTFELVAQALTGKTFGNRPLEVVRVTAPANVAGLHVLFVTRGAPGDIGALLEAARQRPVLVIGETPDFARTGGVIGFVQRGANLRLEINVARAQSAGLVVSGRLASVAEIVRSKP